MSGSQKVPVSITIDPGQLARLDQVAADLDRSRSWVAGRAIEEFLSPSLPPRAPSAAVAELPPFGGSSTSVGCSVGTAAGHDGARPSVVAGDDYYAASMQRQLAHNAAAAEQQRQTRERVTQQNRDYLANLGKTP